MSISAGGGAASESAPLATLADVNYLNTVVDALHAEAAEKVLLCAGVRRESIGPNLLQVAGGSDTLTFTRDTVVDPWMIEHATKLPAPDPNPYTFDRIITRQRFAPGESGKTERQRFMQDGRASTPLDAPTNSEAVTGPLTADYCSAMGGQLLGLIPQRRRAARMSAAAALRIVYPRAA